MNDKKRGDIIAAIATPRGRGAIGCIRISGEGSAAIAAALTGIKFDGIGAQEKYHAKMVRCDFRGRVRDGIMAVVFYGNRSFTGEESAEFYFHGGSYLMEQALYSIIDAGARQAEAGEFTRRAFLNGKIDLTQAEGIADLIDADNILALDAAYEQSEGKIRDTVDSLYARAVTVAAAAEVSIDYPEEDIEEQTREELDKSIAELIDGARRELAFYDGGRIRREGVRVVLTGEVNAGKSTLFNSLLGEDRAIVCDEEGTTRDAVEEKLVYRGISFVLVDTAGIRETESRAEKMGIERSKQEVKRADAVIEVIRGGASVLGGNASEHGCTFTVINSDKKIEARTVGEDTIELNAKSGEGKELLLDCVIEKLGDKLSSGGGAINNARQYAALKKYEETLERAREAVSSLTLDCVCSDLRQAVEALGALTGRNASESVIDEIFSKFCVGK